MLRNRGKECTRLICRIEKNYILTVIAKPACSLAYILAFTCKVSRRRLARHSASTA